MLTESGYKVIPAANAREAVDIFKREGGAFDLIISDVILPDERGPELANKLMKIKPGLKFLFVSGYSNEKYDSQTVGEKYVFLKKPYLLKDLLNAVKKAMGKK